MTQTLTNVTAPARRPVRPLLHLLMWLQDGRALSRQRAALRDLDAQRLADIGVTPTAARTEADRPFWDAPGHWYR